jgi:hypothetical protein
LPFFTEKYNVLWRVDPLLVNDREIRKDTTPLTDNDFANKHVRKATIGNSNRGIVFSVRPIPRCYMKHSWSNELVVGQSPAGENVSTEAENIVGICHEATTSEDTAD